MIQKLSSQDSGFTDALTELLSMPEADEAEVRRIVADILANVRREGDAELVALTNRLDRRTVDSVADLCISNERLKKAYESVDPLVVDALQESVNRVRTYHEQQLAALGGGADWQFEDDFGNRLGQKVGAMQRVGLYAPGGKAAYPSTVIMTAVPAKVAGVEELVLCVPMPEGEVNEVLLAAAYLCDVDHVFGIGGAQAIAAMAYGTESVPAVDKIVGPGNVFVATAKEMVFGTVGIDMIAGPSEVVIVADDTADVECVILDMFAQAEHDEMAQSILISASASLIEEVERRLPEMLEQEARKQIISTSLRDRGALIHVGNLDEALGVVNRIAPEHLQLAIDDPSSCLDQVRWAGAIFLGVNTAEVVGDYTAGPSHVLPTSGTARFGSPLGVYDFQIRTSLIECSREGSIRLNRGAAILADEEGLSAHAGSARARIKG